jgi:hypothetical protein
VAGCYLQHTTAARHPSAQDLARLQALAGCQQQHCSYWICRLQTQQCQQQLVLQQRPGIWDHRFAAQLAAQLAVVSQRQQYQVLISHQLL